MNLNVIRKLRIEYETKGSEQFSASGDRVKQAHDRTTRAIEMLSIQMQQYAQMERQSVQFRQASIDSINRLAAANDNLAKSLSAANDNSRASSEGFRVQGIEAASLINHLKQAAVILYSTSSAFRGLVHASVVPALRGVSAAVTATGAAVNIAGDGLISGGAAIAALGPKFAPIAAGITSAGQAMAAFSPTLASLAVQASGLFSFLVRLAAVVFVVTTVVKALVTSVVDGIRDFTAFQDKQVELANVLKATGGASGKTAEEINKIAESMGDVVNSRQAAKALLEFQSISGNTFDRALSSAHDLAATGFGDVATAARAMGKALEDPVSGLDGLTKAGVRFTTEQKNLIKELVETGRASEAQNQILRIVEGKLGGSAAAAANTLSGAYKSLADATLIGSEQFGAQIVSVTRLQAVIQTLADAMNALNNFKLSDNARTGIDMIMRGVFRIKGKIATPERIDPIDREQVQSGAGITALQQQKDKIDAVKIALNKELDALHQSELQKKIDINLRKAGIAADDQRARSIVATITQIHNEAEEIKLAEEARRKAAATAERQAEQLRRMDSDRQHRIDQLMVERQSIGLSAEAALVLRLREEELAKVRRFGIAETPELVAEIEAWAKATAKVSVENDRLKENFRLLTESATEFAQSFVKGMLDGKNAADAAMASLDRVADRLLNKGIENAISGALSGDPAAAAAGGTQALIALGLKLFTGADAKRKAESEAQLKAWEAWRAAAKDWEAFGARASGQGVSNIRNQVFDASAEASRLALLRSQAMGFKNVQQENADPVIQKLFADLKAYTARLKKAFTDSFDATISAMQAGFGDNSPLLQGLSEVQSLGEKIKTFIADTEEVFGKDSPRARLAREAGITQALSTLDTPKELSETAAQFLKLQGNAQGLQQVLVDLGMSAADAAKAIADKLATAVDALRKSFAEDLTRQLNDLSGKGFLNDFDKLFKDRQKNIETNRTIGGNNGDLIEQLFGLGAQGIVDQFHLTGDAFQELLKKFPELNGKIKEFVEGMDDATKRSLENRIFDAGNDTSTAVGKRAAFERDAQQQITDAVKKSAAERILLEKAIGEERKALERKIAEEIAQRRRSIEDQIFDLTNDATTLDGQIVALRRKQERERLDEIAAGGENLLLLLRKFNLEEEKLRKEFNERKIEEEKRAFEAIRDSINSAARNVLDYLAGLTSGPSSTLSPTDTLANAQALLQANSVLAQGDPTKKETIDAVNKFVSLADNMEKAARAVYGSGEDYQQIRSQIISQGLALPTVQVADDPLVVAMRNAVTAIYILEGTTGGVNTGFLGLKQKAIDLANDLHAASTKANSLATDLQGISTNATALAADLRGISINATSLATDLGAISTNANTLAGKLDGVSTNAITLADKLGGPTGISARMTALGETLSGTGGVSQRLIDLAGTVGTGNDAALRDKMLKLAAEVNDAGGKAKGLGTDAAAAAAQAAQLALDAKESARQAGILATNAATAATKAGDLATAVASAALKADALASAVQKAATDATELAKQIGIAAGKADELAKAIGTPSTGVLLALITFGGSLNNIAGMLLASFDALDTDKNKALSYQEFVAGAGGTSTQALFDTFNALDINKDNQITQLELMVGAQQEGNKLLTAIEKLITTLNKYIGEDGSGSVRSIIAGVKIGTDVMGQVLAGVKFGNDVIGFWVDRTAANTLNLRSDVSTLQSAVADVRLAVGDVRSSIGTGSGPGSLQALTDLMHKQLTISSNVYSITTRGTTNPLSGNITFPDRAVDLLGLIAFNTYAAAQNTAALVGGGQKGAGFAAGGVIPPFGLGLVSEHLNPTFLRAGPEPITVSPYAPAFGRAANDNGALLAEIAALRKEVAAFRKENGVNIMRGAQHVREGTEETTEAVDGQTSALSSQERQSLRQKRVG